MTNKLVRPSPQKDLERRGVDPQIVTTARPVPARLIQARTALASNEELRELFANREVPAEELADRVGIRLAELWGGSDAAEAYETALYLVDEYRQLGQGMYLVSTETGRVVLPLSEEDLYQPAPVPREDGSIAATPLKRIRPDLEGMAISWVFERAREGRVANALAAAVHQTAFLQEHGDPRLQVATRAGRKAIVEALAADNTPKTLLDGLGGPSGAFLRRLAVITTQPDSSELEGLVGPVKGNIIARTTIAIQDLTTSNLNYSRGQSLRGVIPHNWMREIVRNLSETLREATSIPAIRQSELTAQHLAGVDLWVGPPELFATVLRLCPKATYLASERAQLFGVVGKAGILQVSESFQTGSSELFDRWECAADLEYQLWFDPAALKSLPVTDLVYQAVLES